MTEVKDRCSICGAPSTHCDSSGACEWLRWDDEREVWNIRSEPRDTDPTMWSDWLEPQGNRHERRKQAAQQRRARPSPIAGQAGQSG